MTTYDCTDYESNKCPKKSTFKIDYSEKNKLNLLLVGCWGVYCDEGSVLIPSYEQPSISLLELKTKLPRNPSTKQLNNFILENFFKFGEEYRGQNSVVKGMMKYKEKNGELNDVFLAGDNIYAYSKVDKALLKILRELLIDKYSVEYDNSIKKKLKSYSHQIDKQLSKGFSKCINNLDINNFFIAIGNHDIIDCNILNSQLNYNDKKWRLEGVYYNVVYTLKTFKVNIVVIDTNMYSGDKTCSNQYYTKENRNNQKLWVKNVIDKYNCNFNIIIGHIPYKWNTHKIKKLGDECGYNKELGKLLKEVSGKVQVYMCADEHNMQYLYDYDLNMALVIAGSGGTALDKNIFECKGDNPIFNNTNTLFGLSSFGFVSFEFIDKNSLDIKYYSTPVNKDMELVFKSSIEK